MGKKKEKSSGKNKPANGASTKKPKLNALPTSFPSKLLKTKISYPPKNKNSSSSLNVLHKGAVYASPQFLDVEECRSWIDFCESTGMERCAHPATRWIAHRECGRIQINDSTMADRIFSRMQSSNILPQIASQLDISTSSKTYRPVGCNENLRLYRYEKGMSFGRHFDGSHPVERLKGDTEITVLIYLSSCAGGATRFYPPKSSKKSFAFDPQPGAILFHVHGDRCLEHEADPVLNGLKYVLRTDIVYAS